MTETTDLAMLARWLLAQLPRLRLHPAAVEAHDEITSIVDTVRDVIDRPAPRWYAGPCDDCRRDLYADTGPGHALITCPCGRKYDVATRRATLLADVTDKLATATEAARALTAFSDKPVTVDQVKGYVRRGRLVARTVDTHGRAYYRVGDVRDIIESDQRRKTA